MKYSKKDEGGAFHKKTKKATDNMGKRCHLKFFKFNKF